jgi:hypothetical protein
MTCEDNRNAILRRCGPLLRGIATASPQVSTWLVTQALRIIYSRASGYRDLDFEPRFKGVQEALHFIANLILLRSPDERKDSYPVIGLESPGKLKGSRNFDLYDTLLYASPSAEDEALARIDEEARLLREARNFVSQEKKAA